jgi:hypothetical protein
MTSPDTRFLLKRMLRLIGMADDLVTTSAGTQEDQQRFETLKREIEVLNAHLQNTYLQNSRTS